MYDNSQLSTFQMCPLKYKFKYIDGLQKCTADETNIDIIFGQKIHEFLELYYKGKNPDPTKIMESMPDIIGEDTKTPEGGIRLCGDYLEQYKDIDKHYKVLDTERKIEFKINGLPFVVKVDTVIEVNGNIFSLEHKTTKSLNYNYFHQFHVNSQISAQTYAVKKEYGQCGGVIVNALELKFLKRNGSVNQKGFNTKFERDTINRTQEEINYWYDNATSWVKYMEYCKKNNEWLAADNGYNCSSYRGCTYKDICRTAQDIQIIETMYDRIDPYEYLKD